MQDACTDSSGKNDCLWRVVCNITGASCPKMDALFHKLDTEQEKKMTNPAKNTTAAATPKDVKEKVEEKTVPAQATGEKTAKEAQLDKVLDNSGKVLFSGTPDEVRAWLNERTAMIYAVRQAHNNDLIISTEYVEQGPLKLSLVQRAKSKAEKLKKNRKAQLLLAGAVFCAGMAIKNARFNRKAVAAEVLDPEDTTTIGVEQPETPENPDSL